MCGFGDFWCVHVEKIREISGFRLEYITISIYEENSVIWFLGLCILVVSGFVHYVFVSITQWIMNNIFLLLKSFAGGY